MGPWENDDALDWLGAVEDRGPAERGAQVLAALDAYLEGPGHAEAPTVSEAVAAAALVGAAVNPAAAEGTPHLPGWVGEGALDADQELVEKSRRTLRRLVSARDNEWWELWNEAGLSAELGAEMKRVLDWLGDRDD